MSRYFIELMYKGTNYAGFQVQKNANTVQAEVEKALKIFYKDTFELTGSSRTDTGVHALQNYFHFDTAEAFEYNKQHIYNLNAILPADIVLKSIRKVKDDAHCRFDAIRRQYGYYLYKKKDPFLADRAFYYPYKLDMELLQQAAYILKEYEDFTSFSKKNTQVNNFLCNIAESTWITHKNTIEYQVAGNRFLRGMVRALVGTMLKVGTGKTSIKQFREIIESKNCRNADFSVPGQGLFLKRIIYKED
jgi:tRNA pseudouridine38-40 synthase